MLEFSSINIITHQFHDNDTKGYTGIVYDIIIFCDLVVHIGLIADFKCELLERNDAVFTMKEPGNFIVKPNLNKSRCYK